MSKSEVEPPVKRPLASNSGMDDSDEGYEYKYDSASEDDASDADLSDGDFGPHPEVESSRRKTKYIIFSEGKLKERQDEAISQVTGVLGIAPGEAARVLRQYKDAGRVNEEWWTDMDAVRSKVGLAEDQPEPSTSGKPAKVHCGICFEEFKPQDMCAAACRHYFCKDCWKGYISTGIREGPSVLGLRCPIPDCGMAVPEPVISAVASPEEQDKYRRYALRSYVEDNRKMEWCPAPDCEHAVECLVDLSGEPLDVTCACGCSFCFTCKEEAHRPVDCETVKKWIIKNSAESENLNWILANTKPCPKCKRPIEKNQGCMHMTCSQCSHQFCWLCLAAWAEHGERTGGFYACNRYEAAKQKGEYDEEAQKREHAKHALERYMHYYQRWAENDSSRLTAVEKMRKTQEDTLEILSNAYATPTSQLKFITDAWAQVVDCRRILKWTYAFGYYNFDESIKSKFSATVLKQQQEFFEFNQGQAEFYLERLHSVSEKELDDLTNAEAPVTTDEWIRFREKLIGLTDVTRSHFEKLVQELEKGMEKMLVDYNEPLQESEDMDVEEPSQKESASKAKDRKKEPKPKAARLSKRTRASQRSAGANAAGPSDAADLLDMDSEAEEALGFWQCRACSFANQDLTADHCEICQTQRIARS